MAEYRNVEDIREVLFRYAHNEHSKAFSKFLMSEIEQKNKPDVVERSKIDKAIAEIENAKMYRGNPKGLPNDIGLDRYFDKGLMKAIEIIKRNIGGEE